MIRSRNSLTAALILTTCLGSVRAAAPETGIPVTLQLNEPGYVTVVIEDERGHRVRNLISETYFEAGKHTLSWDGLDDLGRINDGRNVFTVDGRYVEPGNYRVRGLVRPKIDLAYQFSVYSEGKPAWRTNDRSSEWLGDHMAPRAVVWSNTTKAAGGKSTPDGQLLVGSPVTEGGSGLAWLDTKGQKLFGQTWVGGVWTGASELAVDTGANAVPGVIAYAAAAWEGGGFDGEKAELRLSEVFSTDRTTEGPRDGRFGTGLTQPLLKPHAPYPGTLSANKSSTLNDADFRFAFPDNSKVGVSGLAVRDGLLVASLPKMGRLLLVDARARRIVGEVTAAAPGGLVFDATGRLLMVDTAARRVLAYDVKPARAGGTNAGAALNLGEPTVVIATGLDAPQRVTVNGAGLIYVTDHGDSHQVKVFSPDGKLVRSIGKAGRPNIGKYDPNHMNYPMGVSIDGKGNVWVAEEDQRPKRISVWSPTGSLIKGFYGPGRYSGGGTLAPDKKHVYYDGMKFAIDWSKGTWALESVLYRDDRDPLRLPTGGHERPPAPERPFIVNGVTYYTNSYSTHPTNTSQINVIWRDQNGAGIPVAMIGRVAQWRETHLPDSSEAVHIPPRFDDTFKSRLPAGVKMDSNDLIVMWWDANGNGQIEPEETTFRNTNVSGATVLPDLTFVTGTAEVFKPVGFTDKHVPRYEFDKPVVAVKGARAPITSGGGQVTLGRDGWTVLVVPPEPFPVQASVSGAKDGVPLWTYPSRWPGLHPSHQAPLPEHPGQLIGTTRLLGPTITPHAGDAGELWAINSDKSNIYLFTTDGLFVATLFKDSRKGEWTFPQAKRGMLVNDASTGQESFYPTITQTNDGEIYLTIGARDCPAIVQVKGLDKIRRLPQSTLTVTAAQIDRARTEAVRMAADKQSTAAKKELIAARLPTDPKVDGDTAEWNTAKWATIDAGVTATLTVSGDRLFGAFRTGEADLLKNSAENLPLLFIGGGGLDLMLGTDPAAPADRNKPVLGDVRLVIANVGGKNTAVLYRPVAPATEGNEPFAFRSPVRTLQFADVQDVSADVQVATNNQGHFEFSIPLERLGIKPVTNAVTLRGDLGVLRGGGVRTRQRAYWSNGAAALTSDVPSEAELLPQFWGTITLQP